MSDVYSCIFYVVAVVVILTTTVYIYIVDIDKHHLMSCVK